MNIKNKRIKNALVIGLSLLLTSTIAVPKVFAEEELEEVEEIEVIEEITEEEEAITPPVEEVVEESTIETVVNTPTIRNFNLFSVVGVETLVADETTLADAFPDVNFRTFVAKTVLGKTTYVDATDSTTVLTASDITKITARTTVSVPNQNISSMEGIQHFVNVTTLYCQNNQITGELKVSNLINLTILYCFNNEISKLDVSNLTELNTLYCNNNKISELDVSNLTKLRSLFCNNNQISVLDVSELTDLAYLLCSVNQISVLDVSKLTNLYTLSCNNNLISALDLSALDELLKLDVYINPISELNISEIAKNKMTSLTYQTTNIDNLDLSNFNALTTLNVTKSTNGNLSKLNKVYITGSRGIDDPRAVRLTGNIGAFSWDSTTGYYVVASNMNGKYGFNVACDEVFGEFEAGYIATSNAQLINLPDGGLVDEEGNLIVGAALSDVEADGTITLSNGGTIVTPEGIFTFEGSVSIKDGIMTTEDNYSFAKNTATYDSQTGTATANIGDIVTYVEVGDGITTISTLGSESEVPAGSVVTNNNGDKTYLIKEGTVDSEGNVTSSDVVITVPAGKVGEITTDADGNIVFPEGSIVTINEEVVTYQGNILYNSEDNTIKYLPVDTLLTEDGAGLAAGTDQEAIDEAQSVVDLLPEGTLKEELQAKIDKAQAMLDAKAAVADLFDETGVIKDTTTQATIDNAQALVDVLPEGTLKEELQAEIDKAQVMLDAKVAVEDLFDETGSIKETTTQTSIDNAQAFVDLLAEGTLKTELQAEIDKAQAMLDAKLAVADLFDETGIIKDTTTQTTIDNAQALVDALEEGTLKTELQAEVDKAQAMLDAKAAVADLFDETGTIKDTTTQATIDNAQALVDALEEGTLKTELQAEINKAQAMLDAKDAVADLFDETGIIKDTTTQTTIDNAQALVDVLPEGTLKEELQAEIDKAQAMLDAKAAVADLLDNTGTIKDTTTQTTIDNAQKLVNKLPEGTLKDELQDKIDDAQTQLDARNNPSKEDPIKKPNTSGTSTETISTVATGDQTNIIVFYGMLISSLLVLVFIIMKRKIEETK